MTATAPKQPNEQSPGDKAEVPAAAAPEQPAGDDKGFMRSLFEAVGGALAKGASGCRQYAFPLQERQRPCMRMDVGRKVEVAAARLTTSLQPWQLLGT
jgi:hypothetical protein